jgi:signal transduction histidine kinase
MSLFDLITRVLSESTSNTQVQMSMIVQMNIHLDEHASREVEMILREAIVNIVRHSRASSAACSCYRSSETTFIKVVDDGVGFDLGARTAGLGLLGMTERARAIGAALQILSEPGAGTTVRLRLESGSAAELGGCRNGCHKERL